MNEYVILQLKKLKAKQTFLESVHEEKNYIFQSKAVPLFHTDFSEIIPKPEKQKFKNERKRPRKLVNDVFKKLSTKLHPDRGGDKKMFQKANEAKENNNLSELLDIANEVNMKIEDDETMIPILKEKNVIVEKTIEMIDKSLAWQWYHMGENEKKQARPIFLEILKKELQVDI